MMSRNFGSIKMMISKEERRLSGKIEENSENGCKTENEKKMLKCENTIAKAPKCSSVRIEAIRRNYALIGENST